MRTAMSAYTVNSTTVYLPKRNKHELIFLVTVMIVIAVWFVQYVVIAMDISTIADDPVLKDTGMETMVVFTALTLISMEFPIIVSVGQLIWWEHESIYGKMLRVCSVVICVGIGLTNSLVCFANFIHAFYCNHNRLSTHYVVIGYQMIAFSIILTLVFTIFLSCFFHMVCKRSSQ